MKSTKLLHPPPVEKSGGARQDKVCPLWFTGYPVEMKSSSDDMEKTIPGAVNVKKVTLRES